MLHISVGELQVIVYVPAVCSEHPVSWALRVIPVGECAYCRCLKENDRRIYDDYMDVVARRHPRQKEKFPFEYFKEMVDQMTADGGFGDRAAKEPIRIFKNTKWVLDGHHRLAIICALLGAGTMVSVEESADALPTDLDKPCNICYEAGVKEA